MTPNILAAGSYILPVSFASCSDQALHGSKEPESPPLQEAAGSWDWLLHAAQASLHKQTQGEQGGPKEQSRDQVASLKGGGVADVLWAILLQLC